MIYERPYASSRKGGLRELKVFWLKQLPRTQQRADELMPRRHKFRDAVGPSREKACARIRAPPPKELSKETGAGGSEWCDQFVKGSPALGELGARGVYPPSNDPPSYISTKLLFANAADRLLSGNRASGPNGRQLWFEAMGQVRKR